MKRTLPILFLVLFFFAFQQNAFACFPDADISGPSGTCVPRGVPITYTGTHNFTTNNCTIYEWTVTGGTITGPTGISVTNGTLCVVENAFICFPSLGDDCDDADISVLVAGGQGADVTVVWEEGVMGELRLNVVEVDGPSDSEIINIDPGLPSPTSISVSNLGTNSGTFFANFDDPPCEGALVRWTINGNNAGTGNPRNLPVGTCVTAQVCAELILDGNTSENVCRNFMGGQLSFNINGLSNPIVNSFVTYQLNVSQPLDKVEWFTQPAGVATFLPPTDGEAVDLTFDEVGDFNICAEVTTLCATSFFECKAVSVSGFIPSPGPGGDDPIKEKVEAKAALREDPGTPLAQTPQLQELKLQPNLIVAQQDFFLQLPALSQTIHLTLLNQNGQVLQERQTGESNLRWSSAGLSPGVYFISARAGQWQSTQRFVIQ
ncbi:MAG: T9SS type A sorting domain-containing protein [Bacteroidota bacterium]